jgi:hypothetical protein
MTAIPPVYEPKKYETELYKQEAVFLILMFVLKKM